MDILFINTNLYSVSTKKGNRDSRPKFEDMVEWFVIKLLSFYLLENFLSNDTKIGHKPLLITECRLIKEVLSKAPLHQNDESRDFCYFLDDIFQHSHHNPWCIFCSGPCFPKTLRHETFSMDPIMIHRAISDVVMVNSKFRWGTCPCFPVNKTPPTKLGMQRTLALVVMVGAYLTNTF